MVKALCINRMTVEFQSEAKKIAERNENLKHIKMGVTEILRYALDDQNDKEFLFQNIIFLLTCNTFR